MTINNRPIPSIQQVQSERLITKPVKGNQVQTGNSFNSILHKQLQQKESLKFSKHANMRLSSRDIQLTDDQMARLENGVDKAEAKGIKESLVLMDNVALVVNIENKTVVTALDHSETREHVFTNIDGAVVI